MSTTTMPPCPGEITQLLIDWGDGDPAAMDRLIPLVVDELRRIAARGLAKSRQGLTFQATDLVSQIYVRLSGQERTRWTNRKQFFQICTQFVRRTLIDRARQRRAARHGGDTVFVPLDENLGAYLDAPIHVGDGVYVDLIDLNNALKRLAEFDSRAVKVIEHRFFAGLTIRETAAVLDVCTMTVDRDWQIAKRWLFRELSAKPAGTLPVVPESPIG